MQKQKQVPCRQQRWGLGLCPPSPWIVSADACTVCVPWEATGRTGRAPALRASQGGQVGNVNSGARSVGEGMMCSRSIGTLRKGCCSRCGLAAHTHTLSPSDRVDDVTAGRSVREQKSRIGDKKCCSRERE